MMNIREHDVVALQPEFVMIAGALGGVMLSQLWQWSDFELDAWVCRTESDWLTATGLDSTMLMKARNRLESHGLIEVSNDRLGVRINGAALEEAIRRVGQ